MILSDEEHSKMKNKVLWQLFPESKIFVLDDYGKESQ
jgi:hypothetical protein